MALRMKCTEVTEETIGAAVQGRVINRNLSAHITQCPECQSRVAMTAQKEEIKSMLLILRARRTALDSEIATLEELLGIKPG